MDRSAPVPAPARRVRGIVLVSLAILGATIAGFVAQEKLDAFAPSSSSAQVGQSTTTQPALDEPGRPRRTTPADPTGRGLQTALGEADGAIPDGVAVSAFDEQMPAVGKLDPDLIAALRRATTVARADGVGLLVNSGWRSPDYQQQLLQDAVIEYGSLEEAARWAATPETSAHVTGDAVDIGPPDAADWLAEHGAAYGLCQTYANEPWHLELRPDAVDDGCPAMYADPTQDPRMQP